MLHPGFLPILNLNAPSGIPPTEIVSIYLEVGRMQILIRWEGLSDASSSLMQELLALREQMEFEAILPAHVPQEWLAHGIGIHLRANAEEIAQALAVLNGNKCIVCFANSRDEAALAEQSGADAVILGPVFGENGIGIGALEDACQTLSVPVFAAGGIDAGNLLQVKDAGAYGFCTPDISPDDENFEHELEKLVTLWDDFSGTN